MRVISGKYKGKKLIGFDIDGTRPTMDRVKESIFSMIQKDILNKTVLDLFSGSGSLGIEAISNKASMCYFVDNNKLLIDIIRKNTKNMNGVNIIKDDYKNALIYFKNNNIKFDIIFLDPPYKFKLINDSINKIHEYDLLNKGGIIVCEYEIEDVDTDYYTLIKEKRYGSKFVKIYKY